MRELPPQIIRSLDRFRKEYPNPEKVAFVNMKLAPGHEPSVVNRIFDVIRKTLQEVKFITLLVDEKAFHEDPPSNELTYLYGCSFGIAVFERGPGYLRSYGKPVFWLRPLFHKDNPSDSLSQEPEPYFDAYKPETTIPTRLRRWLLEQDLPHLFPMKTDLVSFPTNLTYTEQLGLQLSELAQVKFIQYCFFIDTAYRLQGRSNPVTQDFDSKDSEDLIAAVCEAYRRRGFTVIDHGVDPHSSTSQNKRTIEFIP